MKESPIVFNIQQGCIHDGPGIRTNIFFNGCALRCKWCANPESQSFRPSLMWIESLCTGCGNCATKCDQGAVTQKNGMFNFDRTKCVSCGACTQVCYTKAREIQGKTYTAQELIEIAAKDAPFYRSSGGGVTFTGGEPALWPETVKTIAKWHREEGYSTAIETCGYAPWENFAAFLPYISTVLFDLKIWDPQKHSEYCGESNELIFQNLERTVKTNETIIRMPIIPGINDSKAELCAIAQYVRSLKVIKRIHILPYHNLAVGKYKALGRQYALQDVLPPSAERMEQIRSMLQGYGFEVIIGG